MSGTDDSKLFSEIVAFNDFFAGHSAKTELLLPSREQVGLVYRFITEAPASADRIKYAFINELGFGKTSVAVRVMEELGLIKKDERNIYQAVNKAEKTNLMNSDTYKLLTERSGKND